MDTGRHPLKWTLLKAGIYMLIPLGLFFRSGFGQSPYLSHLHAGKDFPLYTGYAAACARSEYLLDEGYRFRYFTDSLGADMISDKAGDLGCAFRIRGRTIYRISDFYQPPVITASYPDMVRYRFEPVKGLLVRAWFFIYSSRVALWQLDLKNLSGKIFRPEVLFFIHARDSMFEGEVSTRGGNGLVSDHQEKPDSWSRDHQIPYVENIRDLLVISKPPDRMLIAPQSIFQDQGPFSGADSPSGKTELHSGHLSLEGLGKALVIAPGKSASIRLARAVSPAGEGLKVMEHAADSLLDISLMPYFITDERVAEHTPAPHFEDPGKTALYWSACNMMRQVFYPPEGNCRHKYYVFSRQPLWGWGHGGQVFQESLSMLEYVHLDPRGAMGSQEIFADRQHPDGYINYRTGPWLDETIPFHGSLTSSAPWYNWENWKIYQTTHNRGFLVRMYRSGKKFYQWFISRRDSDRDGLCEWGGQAVLESVRDGETAVWDQVGWPSNFDSPDLNCMLVMEARSLEKMAVALGLDREARVWKADYTRRAALINKYCWDPVNGFYYNVTKGTHLFSYHHPNDLKRDEISGFLPLWAGIASPDQAARLVKKLTDTSAFWRQGGIPSLSAADADYHPQGYWNGPVWVQWNYLIQRGLLHYGYKKLAAELADRLSREMITVLARNHELWEFYSPDKPWGGYHRTYIWAGLINRMMTRAEEFKPQVK